MTFRGRKQKKRLLQRRRRCVLCASFYLLSWKSASRDYVCIWSNILLLIRFNFNLILSVNLLGLILLAESLARSSVYDVACIQWFLNSSLLGTMYDWSLLIIVYEWKMLLRRLGLCVKIVVHNVWIGTSAVVFTDAGAGLENALKKTRFLDLKNWNIKFRF